MAWRPSAAPAANRRSDGELTRRRVLDAAIESILESGYYHTSSNEIARRAGVTWGTLQHQFGTREGLLLAVLSEAWAELEENVGRKQIEGRTLEERLREVLDVLVQHYGRPAHLAHMQILLDLVQNPTTSEQTRKAALSHGRALARAWQPLFARALGRASNEEDLVTYAFSTLRGYLVGELVAGRILPTPAKGVRKQLLVRGVAAAIREEAKARNIDID